MRRLAEQRTNEVGSSSKIRLAKDGIVYKLTGGELNIGIESGQAEICNVAKLSARE